MKINESTFRRIIREEARRALREDVAMSPTTGSAAPAGVAPAASQIPKFRSGDPATLLGIPSSVSGVQDRIQAIQTAMNNPQDVIFGINKDQNAIQAHNSLKHVLSQAISNVPLSKQLGDVRQAASDWIRWATMNGKTTMTANDKKTHDFLTAAAERLQANQPVFNFPTEKVMAPAQSATKVELQDPGWKKYLEGDPKRAPIWVAWLANREAVGLASDPLDLFFSNFVMWWKDKKSRKMFSDNNAGGIDATVKLLNSGV